MPTRPLAELDDIAIGRWAGPIFECTFNGQSVVDPNTLNLDPDPRLYNQF